MSQHDMDVANGSGVTVRSDINNALQALATCFSGGTAPGTKFAFMWWADTANDLLKQRNAANTAWISILKLSTGRALLASEANAGPGATPFSFRNKLINGNFLINQRAYVSGTAMGAANQYTLDRWRVVTSGQNLTFSASGNGNSVTAPAGGIEQVIEGSAIEGGIYTLSWTGAGTCTVNGSAVTNGGQTASLTAGANVTVKFVGAVSKVQMEIGSVNTPFEHRPISAELAMCQRYFERTGCGWNGIAYASTTVINISGVFKVSKRVNPTLVFESGTGSNAVVQLGGSLQTVGSASSYSPNVDGAIMTLNGIGYTSGAMYTLVKSVLLADAEI